MSTALSVEDIAELRKQGDFREFLRLRLGTIGPAPAPTTPAAPAAPAPAAGHRPGAWPAGTSRPTPTAPQSAADWEQAVHAYRAWNAAGQPSGDFTCECGCTPGARGGAR